MNEPTEQEIDAMVKAIVRDAGPEGIPEPELAQRLRDTWEFVFNARVDQALGDLLTTGRIVMERPEVGEPIFRSLKGES